MPRNTRQNTKQIQKIPEKYTQIPQNTPPPNTNKYTKMPKNAKNTPKYQEIQKNTKQYKKYQAIPKTYQNKYQKHCCESSYYLHPTLQNKLYI